MERIHFARPLEELEYLAGFKLISQRSPELVTPVSLVISTFGLVTSGSDSSMVYIDRRQNIAYHSLFDSPSRGNPRTRRLSDCVLSRCPGSVEMHESKMFPPQLLYRHDYSEAEADNYIASRSTVYLLVPRTAEINDHSNFPHFNEWLRHFLKQTDFLENTADLYNCVLLCNARGPEL